MSLVLVQDLHKDYATAAGAITVLKQVNFTMDAGDFVAIMGPSGSGKSTFMNILGCLDKPTSGQ
ncbi:MAG: ATP-binding cassette domain-containing protein, partial [Methylotenera sp.]|nr:ATP-binding cassette domain-containing protein [Methylotenera sp.]